MSSFYLPMTDCSACNRHVGHLYDTYYSLTERLLRRLSTSTSISEFAESIRDSDYTYEDETGVSSIGRFLRTYYSWASKQPPKAITFEPANVVARALLRIRELRESDLPFGRPNRDGQRNQFDASICCLRMFQCDPSMQSL